MTTGDLLLTDTVHINHKFIDYEAIGTLAQKLCFLLTNGFGILKASHRVSTISQCQESLQRPLMPHTKSVMGIESLCSGMLPKPRRARPANTVPWDDTG